ncbi:MAG: CHAT domain-containing protein [Cyanothece sp. SIO2G6]|nr:CHAT domain-containing protein [Cyanothece sp. SIO2G6]
MTALLFTVSLSAHRVPAHAQSAPVSASESSSSGPDSIPLASDRVLELERNWGRQYYEYFERSADAFALTTEEISQRLAELSAASGEQSALIYTLATPDALELILVLPNGSVVHRTVRDAASFQLNRTIRELHRSLTLRRNPQSPRSLAPSQRLYQWIMKPLEPILDSAQIDVLLFCAGPGLRTLPFAALHDGQRFLSELYGVALIPAFNLINPHHQPLQDVPILAMGASEFQQLDNLPAVPSELEAIAQLPWPSTTAINPAFTVDNLTQHLQTASFPIVHLATHAQFLPGNLDQSFLQLWDNETLNLRQVNELPWKEADVDLLVLSACQTAVGDRQAELGFAGVAYQAGVNSTVASLWRVSDLGTFVLMQEFYAQLINPTVQTKVEALRRAQQTLINGDVYIQDGQIHNPRGTLPLPPFLGESAEAQSIETDFANPYYWSAFTLIGNPW